MTDNDQAAVEALMTAINLHTPMRWVFNATNKAD